MNDIEPSAKLTFRKPVLMDHWSGWEIVIDSLPVADFGEPENNTVKLLDGHHEIYLRHQLMPGIFSATQKLKVKLEKGDEVTVKLDIDPKLHLFVAFCVVMTLISFPPQQEALGHIIQLGCLGIMILSIFSLIKGFAHRLSIVKPESTLKFAPTEVAVPQKLVEADSVVQRLASEFAENIATKKSKPEELGATSSADKKKQFSDWSYYLMLLGILTFNTPPPLDCFGVVALFISAAIKLFSVIWSREHLLRNLGHLAYLAASTIGIVVAFSPHLGTLAPAVFLSISLCIGIALALNFGASIAECMERSKFAGVFSILLNSVLAFCVIQLLIPMLLQFVAQHI